MFRSFSVKNFRCFRELELKPLGRVNLIAGMNNSGKTAVLEALDFFGNKGSPQIAFDLNQARGVSPHRVMTKESCSWMFLDRDIARPIEMTAEAADQEKSLLKMWIVQRSAGTPEQTPEEEAVRQLGREVYWTGYPYLVSHFVAGDGSEAWSSALLADTRPYALRSEELKAQACVSLGVSEPLHPLSLEFFSRAEVQGRQEEVLSTLRYLEPALKRIVLLVLEGEPALYGEVGRKQLVPLTFMGEGVRRVLSILLAIVSTPRGIILVDEMENGLHHSVQEKVWLAIAHAARQADAQVFATTHSYECIQAAHRANKASGSYDLRFFRLDRTKDGIRVGTSDEEIMETAIDMNLEVR